MQHTPTRPSTRAVACLAATLLLATACGDRDRDETAVIADSTAYGATMRADSAGAAGTLAGDIDIESVDLGRSVGADGKISDGTDEFRTNDVIIAVVETDDDASGKELVARWTYGDNHQLVEEQRQTVAAGEDARTQFKLTKGGAWPAGKYTLHILHNGREVEKKEFSVK